MKVGIFGGSFNPVHLDHVKIANALIEELSLDKLYIVPTYIAPHKQNAEVISGEVRFNMLNLAFETNDKVVVSNYELMKKGISYSYETVEHFKHTLNPEVLYFIVGSDMLDNFPTWKYPERILELSSLVAVERRNGEFNDSLSIKKIDELFKKPVVTVKVFGETISSTKVRVYSKLNLPLDDLVPEKVKDYIEKNALYKGDKLYESIISYLPIKRRVHTAGVILMATSLAKRLGADVKKAEISALLHDIAKYERVSDYPDFSLPSDTPEDIIHQYLGEHIIKSRLGVLDEEILNAVKYHTTGRENMTLLEKIVYVADLLEPSRKFLGVDDLREEIKKDFDKGFVICLEEIVEFLLKSGKEVYPLTLRALKYVKEN